MMNVEIVEILLPFTDGDAVGSIVITFSAARESRDRMGQLA